MSFLNTIEIAAEGIRKSPASADPNRECVTIWEYLRRQSFKSVGYKVLDTKARLRNKHLGEGGSGRFRSLGWSPNPSLGTDVNVSLLG